MIHLRIYDPIILAIDLRHRRFGYAVFEGHRLLLDWGVRVYRAVGDVEAAMASKRIAALLRLYSPSAIVLKKERLDRVHTSAHIRILVEAVRREASVHAIPICLLEQSQISEAFRNLGCDTREEIADALARIFPELHWHLPPKRQPGHSEHPRMTVFDAIALGLTYWQAKGTEIPPPE